MAYIRRKRKKWQVLIRKKFVKNIAKTFVLKEDAERYARETEAQIKSAMKRKIDIGLPSILYNYQSRLRRVATPLYLTYRSFA